MNDVLVYKTAGGVVVNDKGEMLALARTVVRNGRPVSELRLPKGHIDPGETDQEAALREVGEESGYWNTAIVGDLGEAHSSFQLEGVCYERDEHYFLMHLQEGAREAPQPVSEEEALFEPQWIPLEKAAELCTYATEKMFAARAIQFLQNRT